MMEGDMEWICSFGERDEIGKGKCMYDGSKEPQ